MSLKFSSIATAILIVALAALISADTAAILPLHTAMLKPYMAVTAIPAMAVEPLAYTIREFCRAHGISICTYYELKKQNLAPAEMRMGRVVRISTEAAAAWRQARESPDVAEAEQSALTARVMQERARQAAKHAIASPHHISRRRIAEVA
jgi:hypothetical protein